jgi:hypothetical protein
MYKIDVRNTKEIYDFCLLNKILDIDGFINKCFKNGFHIEKYGFIGEDSGKTLNEDEKDLKTDEIGEKDLRDSRKTCGIEEKREGIEVIREKREGIEVIREIRVEVPVEVIKYVDREVIKEIKVEVPVEKIVYIYDKKEENSVPNIDKIRDKNEINELLLKIQQLENQEPIIKEVIIEVEKSNDKTLLLQETLNKLRKELTEKNSKITELEGTIKKLEQTNINQGAAYMKGSNLTKNI